jgi:hypothetical protein
MRSLFAALFAVSLLVAAPAAGADVTQSETVETVSVVGIGHAPLPPAAGPAEADAAYRQSLVQAVADGLLKAQALAGATGAKVGPIEGISEKGTTGGHNCKNAAGESAPYTGAEPDAGSAGPPIIAVEPTVPRVAVGSAPATKRPTPTKKHKHKHKAHKRIERRAHRVTARKAENTAVSCEISSEVSLIYNLEVAR